MKHIRRHLTYANVVSTLTLFLVLGGGTALAAYVVSSNSQIGPGTVSGHKLMPGNHANVIAGSVNGMDVADGTLTGADIADRSVDTCQSPLTIKLGPICAGSDGVKRDWFAALHYCSGLGLRLPTTSEAVALAEHFDVPGVNDSQLFWTDEELYVDNYQAVLENEVGSQGFDDLGNPHQAVCVTEPQA
jgi:hypothetical protein